MTNHTDTEREREREGAQLADVDFLLQELVDQAAHVRTQENGRIPSEGGLADLVERLRRSLILFEELYA